MIEIKPFHYRMAELWQKELSSRNKIAPGKPITVDEMKELHDCLTLHVDYLRKQAELYNLSLLASMTDDKEWQHEICARIDKL